MASDLSNAVRSLSAGIVELTKHQKSCSVQQQAASIQALASSYKAHEQKFHAAGGANMFVEEIVRRHTFKHLCSAYTRSVFSGLTLSASIQSLGNAHDVRNINPEALHLAIQGLTTEKCLDLCAVGLTALHIVLRSLSTCEVSVIISHAEQLVSALVESRLLPCLCQVQLQLRWVPGAVQLFVSAFMINHTISGLISILMDHTEITFGQLQSQLRELPVLQLHLSWLWMAMWNSEGQNALAAFPLPSLPLTADRLLLRFWEVLDNAVDNAVKLPSPEEVFWCFNHMVTLTLLGMDAEQIATLGAPELPMVLAAALAHAAQHSQKAMYAVTKLKELQRAGSVAGLHDMTQHLQAILHRYRGPHSGLKLLHSVRQSCHAMEHMPRSFRSGDLVPYNSVRQCWKCLLVAVEVATAYHVDLPALQMMVGADASGGDWSAGWRLSMDLYCPAVLLCRLVSKCGTPVADENAAAAGCYEPASSALHGHGVSHNLHLLLRTVKAAEAVTRRTAQLLHRVMERDDAGALQDLLTVLTDCSETCLTCWHLVSAELQRTAAKPRYDVCRLQASCVGTVSKVQQLLTDLCLRKVLQQGEQAQRQAQAAASTAVQPLPAGLAPEPAGQQLAGLSAADEDPGLTQGTVTGLQLQESVQLVLPCWLGVICDLLTMVESSVEMGWRLGPTAWSVPPGGIPAEVVEWMSSKLACLPSQQLLELYSALAPGVVSTPGDADDAPRLHTWDEDSLRTAYAMLQRMYRDAPPLSPDQPDASPAAEHQPCVHQEHSSSTTCSIGCSGSNSSSMGLSQTVVQVLPLMSAVQRVWSTAQALLHVQYEAQLEHNTALNLYNVQRACWECMRLLCRECSRVLPTGPAELVMPPLSSHVPDQLDIPLLLHVQGTTHDVALAPARDVAAQQSGAAAGTTAAAAAAALLPARSTRSWEEVCALLAVPGGWRRVGCSNPGCTNLSGPCEAQLQLHACGGGCGAWYCGVQCQRAAWARFGHQQVCRAASELRGKWLGAGGQGGTSAEAASA